MPATTVSPVNALADRFWAGILELQPLLATMLGDESSADRWDDPGPAGREREQQLVAQVLAEAAAIVPDQLDTEERITLDMIRVVGHLRQQAHEHRLWQLEAIDQISGPQTLPNELARLQRVDSPERVARLIARLDAYPALMEAHLANLREGVRAGRTASRRAVELTLAQVRRMAEAPPEGSPVLAAHPELPASARDAIRDAVARSVMPALGAMHEALEAYLPDARTGVGVCWLPDGESLYAFHILASTTLPESARVLHDHGLERIEAIRDEMAGVARDLGHADIAALRAALATDPHDVAAEPGDLVALASAQVERASLVAPRWFGRLPVAPVVVRPVESHVEREAPPAFYQPPAPDGSRPGVYFVNTWDPASRPLHRLAATTFHEAVPGHHFQIALESELETLPDLRRYGARMAGLAYTEGWGLYSERLADEMGLYASPRERFGMLQAQAWRAARLVVDTGMHAFGWERERSVELLRDAAGLSRLEAETETDRYISWPGQALAYMTGQREIDALRRSLEARDRDRFDLPGFHDALLGHGTLSLATLRAELPQWVRPLTS